MRLKRFFVTGLPAGTKHLVSEFLLFHGVGTVTVTDRPELQRLQIDCFYNSKDPKAWSSGQNPIIPQSTED